MIQQINALKQLRKRLQFRETRAPQLFRGGPLKVVTAAAMHLCMNLLCLLKDIHITS